MRGKELILQVGHELMSEDFNLDDPEIESNYQKVYEHFCNIAVGKGKNKKYGLFVVGNIGAGKTAMMRVMQRLFKDTPASFKLVTAYELKDMSEIYTVLEIKEMYGYKLDKDLLIDDIGIGIETKRYGNTVNIISEIIMDRYDLFVKTGIRTHFTSNLKPKSEMQNVKTIESLYGTRCLDRMQEMCVATIFNGKSLRTKL